MRKLFVACAACAAFAMAAPAQDLPRTSEFLTLCYRDSTTCRAKLRDYITAADTQKSICRPKGESLGEAVSEMLDWMRMSDKRPANFGDQPYDEGFWIAASSLWPCPQEPSAPAPQDQGAPSDQAAPPPPG